MERRVALILVLFLLGAGTAFIGPFFEEKNLPVMLVAIVITGFLCGPIMVMPMQEMMESIKLAYPNCDFEHASNLLSGLFTSCIGAG